MALGRMKVNMSGQKGLILLPVSLDAREFMVGVK